MCLCFFFYRLGRYFNIYLFRTRLLKMSNLFFLFFVKIKLMFGLKLLNKKNVKNQQHIIYIKTNGKVFLVIDLFTHRTLESNYNFFVLFYFIFSLHCYFKFNSTFCKYDDGFENKGKMRNSKVKKNKNKRRTKMSFEGKKKIRNEICLFR